MAVSNYFVGVDVGTGSARAALVSENGEILKKCSKDIQTWNPLPDYYEQSSENIWNAVVYCIKNVIKHISPERVKGIGFDATCSLVALDINGNSISVSPTGNDEQNIILWMDHRASIEAEIINRTKHPMLKYVGDKVSLEMEIPKILWLKTYLPQQWEKIKILFDLPDFLTWKATDCQSRSLCSLVCKWNYEATTEIQGWNYDFFKQINLDDLKTKQIGENVLPPGAPVKGGLSKRAAKELGLLENTPVGTSIIDAHAGGLGMIGCNITNIDQNFESRLSLICGTSTCHMAVACESKFVQGIWGPYYSAMIPGMWLNEGGQSATGKLIDHIIESHPATSKIQKKLTPHQNIHDYLNNLLNEMAEKNTVDKSYLTKNLHVWPDYHGNRSPFADPNFKGMICGLNLDQNEENLAILYLATIQALAYGTRLIINTLIDDGYKNFKSVLICGGLSKNSYFIQTHADVFNLPIICPYESESVLLGSAILGAFAAGHFKDMREAVNVMSGTGEVINPNSNQDIIEYHNKKYAVFLKMIHHQKLYNTIMND